MYDYIIKKLDKSKKIVAFTGAGMSTESGIPDFRSENGLYSESDFNGYSPEEILSHSFFITNTELFYRYYFKNIVHKDAKPNKGHKILADLGKKGFQITIITQNIDGLHSAAGSKDVIELHGSIHGNYCMKCGYRYDIELLQAVDYPTPVCKICNGTIRPDVTLYEEMLDQSKLSYAVKKISSADILLVIGSSLVVYPAAGLIDYFKGELFVIINKEPTPYDKKADFVINESSGIVLEALTGNFYE